MAALSTIREPGGKPLKSCSEQMFMEPEKERPVVLTGLKYG